MAIIFLLPGRARCEKPCNISGATAFFWLLVSCDELNAWGIRKKDIFTTSLRDFSGHCPIASHFKSVGVTSVLIKDAVLNVRHISLALSVSETHPFRTSGWLELCDRGKCSHFRAMFPENYTPDFKCARCLFTACLLSNNCMAGWKQFSFFFLSIFSWLNFWDQSKEKTNLHWAAGTIGP